MQYTVKNDTPFQILTSAIVIGPSQTGYQLEVAADGKNFSPLFTVGANVTRQVTNLSSGAYYRLNGNVGDVIVNWVRSCVTPGGSGGAGNELAPVSEFPLGAEAGTVVAYSGSSSAAGVYQYDGSDWALVSGDDSKTIVDFDHTSQAERASIYAELKALYDAGSGATINRNYDFYKTVNTWQGLKIDYYSFSADTLVFGKVVSPENLTDQVVYEQVMTIDSAGTVAVVTNTVGGGGSSEDIELPIAAAVNELKGNFEARLSQKYYTRQEVNDIAAGKTDPAQVDEQIKDYVDPAIAEVNDTIKDKELPVSAALNKLNEDIATIDEVIPAAIVDINGRMVSSATVKTIWRGSQAEYDAITVKDAATLYIII